MPPFVCLCLFEGFLRSITVLQLFLAPATAAAGAVRFAVLRGILLVRVAQAAVAVVVKQLAGVGWGGGVCLLSVTFVESKKVEVALISRRTCGYLSAESCYVRELMLHLPR